MRQPKLTVANRDYCLIDYLKHKAKQRHELHHHESIKHVRPIDAETKHMITR